MNIRTHKFRKEVFRFVWLWLEFADDVASSETWFLVKDATDSRSSKRNGKLKESSFLIEIGNQYTFQILLFFFFSIYKNLFFIFRFKRCFLISAPKCFKNTKLAPHAVKIPLKNC